MAIKFSWWYRITDTASEAKHISMDRRRITMYKLRATTANETHRFLLWDQTNKIDLGAYKKKK